MKKKIFIPIMLIVLVLSFIGCGDSSNSSTTYAKVGSSVTLTDGGIFCSSKKNVDKMIDFISAKNKDGQNKMFSNGEAIIIEKGEKVNITDKGMAITEVEYKNQKWYAPMEVVK